MKKFFRSEDGIAVTEYGLLIALVAIALIAVVYTADLALPWLGFAALGLVGIAAMRKLGRDRPGRDDERRRGGMR